MSEVKNIPDGWVETTLLDVTSFLGDGLHGTPNYSDDGEYYFINGNNLTDGKIEIKPETKRCSIDEYNKYKKNLNDRTILVSINGSLGYFAYYNNEKCFLGKSACYFNVKEDIDKMFVGYQIRSNYFQKYIERLAGGTTIKNVSLKTMREFPFIIPKNINEQKAIANILTAFDNKIELLQAQNKTLEATAQTIFAEWFGKYSVDDELPEGWSVGKIGDLIEIRRGSSPRPIQDYISDSGYKWLKISDATATDSPYIFEIKEHIIIEGLKNTTLKKAGDLVLSNSATPGMPKILAIDTCVHDGWMHFPSSQVSNEYLYLLFLSIRPALVQQGSGSVFTNLKTDILREFDVIISTKDYYDEFDAFIKPIFNKIYNNSLQIQNLTKTRDELLPRLMSGEIRVNEFKV